MTAKTNKISLVHDLCINYCCVFFQIKRENERCMTGNENAHHTLKCIIILVLK